MHKPEFYRLQNQQANPTQQQMPTPIIRRITCERKNWRPFFHQMIQVWVEKMRELINIFYNISHQYSNHACKETSSASKGLQIKAKLKQELNAIAW